MIAALSVTAVCRCALATGNQKELKAQAEALLAKSHDLSNIEASGSSPFMLTAQLRFVIDGKTGAGQGEIIWLGPGHYRETYSAPGYNYVEVAKDGQRYLSRTQNDVPLLIYELKTLLAMALHPQLNTKKLKSATTMQDASGKTLTCAEMKLAVETLTACLNDDGGVATMNRTFPAEQMSLNASYEFSDFASFDLRRFPLNMKFQGGDGHEVAVAVQTITPIVDVSAQHFDAPAGSMEEPWCAELKTIDRGPPVQSNLSAWSSLGIRTPRTTVVYLEIAPGGRPRGVTLIHSTAAIRQDDLERAIFGMRFPIVGCGGDGIEYEMEMSISAPPSVLP